MKNKIILSIVLLFSSSTMLYSQYVNGDIRTNSAGAWNYAFLNTETDWEVYNSGSWSDVTAPSTITSRVFINHDIAIGSGTVTPITISTGGQIIIATDASLRVLKGGVFSNSDVSKIIINADATGAGQLLLYTGENAAATQKVYLTANKWHLIGSPFASTPVSAFTGNYMQKYNESDNTWLWNYESGFPTTLTRAQGYSAWRDASATYTLTGTSYAADVVVPLTFSGGTVANYGFTLLSNPYTCGVRYTSSWDMTGLSSNIAVWNQISGNYDYYGANAYTIPSGAGFFVKANSSGQSIKIAASSRSYTVNSNPLKNANEDIVQQVKLTVKNIDNDYLDRVLINVANEGAVNYVPSCDFPKMFGSDDSPALFIKTQDDVDIAVKGINSSETYSFDLQLKPNVDATYVITTSDFSFDAKTEMLLEDLFTSQIFTIDENLNYTFTSNASDIEDRFKIHITPTANAIAEPNENQFKIFGNNYQLSIYSEENNYKMTVYNLLGQKMTDYDNLQGNQSIDLSAYHQKIVIVSIQTENEIISKKIQLK
ncbi:MAG: T9SS type A sorting domain-containing protein [Bacteroidales bacterium]|nr:T9SS type A sorting domain-containing protein [Bacteroidales bacterium]